MTARRAAARQLLLQPETALSVLRCRLCSPAARRRRCDGPSLSHAGLAPGGFRVGPRPRAARPLSPRAAATARAAEPAGGPEAAEIRPPRLTPGRLLAAAAYQSRSRCGGPLNLNFQLPVEASEGLSRQSLVTVHKYHLEGCKAARSSRARAAGLPPIRRKVRTLITLYAYCTHLAHFFDWSALVCSKYV